jgi:hypothetical protein
MCIKQVIICGVVGDCPTFFFSPYYYYYFNIKLFKPTYINYELIF